MTEKWYGIDSDGTSMTVVGLDFEDTETDIATQSRDDEIAFQKGDRTEALLHVFRTVQDDIQKNGIANVVIKASSSPPGRASVKLLLAAEFRGVIIAGAKASGARVLVISNADMSKNHGKRNKDDYANDPHYWKTHVTNSLTARGKPAALLIFFGRKK